MISDEEKIARKKSIDFARGNVRLEGIILTPEQEVLNERFIAGEISQEEFTSMSLEKIFSKVHG